MMRVTTGLPFMAATRHCLRERPVR